MSSIYNRYNFDILLENVPEHEAQPAPEFLQVPTKSTMLEAIRSHSDLPPNLFSTISSDVDFSKTDWMGIQSFVETLSLQAPDVPPTPLVE